LDIHYSNSDHYRFRRHCKKISKCLLASEVSEIHKKEIDALKSRVNELENYPGQEIEKRLLTIESIVVDI
jgi:hypothetical protein